MKEQTLEKQDAFNLAFIFGIFSKTVAILFIGFSIRYWLIAIGVPDESFRFDTMPVHWKSAVATLTVLQPIVALGLWGGFKWGVVVWFVAIAIEGLMYGVYPHLFGAYNMLLFFHFACLVVFVFYALVSRWEAIRKKRD